MAHTGESSKPCWLAVRCCVALRCSTRSLCSTACDAGRMLAAGRSTPASVSRTRTHTTGSSSGSAARGGDSPWPWLTASAGAVLRTCRTNKGTPAPSPVYQRIHTVPGGRGLAAPAGQSERTLPGSERSSRGPWSLRPDRGLHLRLGKSRGWTGSMLHHQGCLGERRAWRRDLPEGCLRDASAPHRAARRPR